MKRDVSPEQADELTDGDRDLPMSDAPPPAASSSSSSSPSALLAPLAAPPPAAYPRRRRRARDVVSLNVGGTAFTTSVATLSSDSSYFKSMFSDRWSSAPCCASDSPPPRGGPVPADEDRIGGVAAAASSSASASASEPPSFFIDQDSRPFALLLTYMRGGGINLDEGDACLSRRVILQAQFFGVEGFLRVVKARAYRNNHADFEGGDEAAIDGFDKEYGGLDEAISSGVLPEAYFRPIPDHVVINAGGTIFETSKRTLTERSPYFETLFKKSPRERTYFLDVDSAAFGILLKYMRHAEFDLPRNNVALFRCVLALAQRFEIRGFIEYVKARTYAIQSGHDPREWLTFLDRHHHPIEDSDNADAFNENYEGIDEAFVTGILPDGFFENIKKA